MTSDHNSPTELISKYLAGEASPDEAIAVADWLQVPENKAEFDKLSLLWYKTNNQKTPALPNKEAMWNQLQTGIRSGRIRRLKQIFYYAAAACVVIGLLITGILISNNRTSTTSTEDHVVHTANDEIRSDSMSDGSVITLHKQSRISYAKYFGKDNRQVTLHGQAFFNVAHDPSKPFIISVGEIKVQVVGTSFNVQETEDGFIKVEVESGIVKLEKEDQQLLVRKGETGLYNSSLKAFTLRRSVNANNFSYATRSFYFNDISLADACHYLEEAFSVQIQFDQKKMSNCRLTATFEGKPLGYILEVLSATLDLKHKMSGKVIYLTGPGC
jgi:transmembrane sensor